MSLRPRTFRWYPAVTHVVLILLWLVAFVLWTDLIDGAPGIAPEQLWSAPTYLPWWSVPLRMFANALPGLLLALMLLTLTRRLLLSMLSAFALQAVLYGVNALKIANLGAPLMPNDFRMVGQMGHGGGDLLAGYLPQSAWPYVIIIGGIALLIALIRYEAPLLRKRPRGGRQVCAVVTALLLGTLLAGVAQWSVVYSKSRLGLRPWSAKATVKYTGLVNSLLLFRLQYGEHSNKPDVDAALQFMAAHDSALRTLEAATPTPALDEQQPNIVVILSESFFDPTILNGYDKNVDFLPNLHRLARHGTSGQMHSPTFGGGTIRTEFEVLTGLPLRYFTDIMFPYLQLNQKVIPGIVRLLKQQGYETLAVHGGDPHFWNRVSAFKALGFDKFISESDFPADDAIHDGKYMSDQSFTNELLRQIKLDGPPQFVLGISIEAHGPYDKDYGIDTKVRDAIPVPATVTGSAKTDLQNYIYHIRHADQQLGHLADTLAKRKRPTLIAFFGDHLPAIVPAFQQAGFRNGEGFLVQTVPYLLIDTRTLKTAKPVNKEVAAWELPGMLLTRIPIHDNYFALTQLVAPRLQALTRAPDAPPAPEDAEQKQLDEGMRNVARLRLESKLDALWPKAAAMAVQQQAAVPINSVPATATVLPATAQTVHSSR